MYSHIVKKSVYFFLLGFMHVFHGLHTLANLRPWPNDSIFHSIFSSTFDLKVERSRACVAKRLDFSLDISVDFSTTHISATCIS